MPLVVGNLGHRSVFGQHIPGLRKSYLRLGHFHDKNTMFKELLKFYDADPRKVIHIGDSISDVVGAKREGIIACWLNRDKKIWEHELKPDLIIESLNDLEVIL